jgi:uncharacterized protein (TIGR02246 family)
VVWVATMFRRSVLGLVLIAVVGCAPDGGEKSQGEAAIVALLAAQAQAWNAHDARAWVTPFTADADFVNIRGTLFQGRAQIEQRHAELFRGVFSKSRVTVTTRKVVSLGATAALAETVHELRDYERLPPGIAPSDVDGTLRTRLKYVLVLNADGWRIRSAQNTAVLPTPPPR